MEFGLLGTLEVRDGDGPLPLGGPKQRALLALLLLHANRVLARERLIDELWGEEPPDDRGQGGAGLRLAAAEAAAGRGCS